MSMYHKALICFSFHVNSRSNHEFLDPTRTKWVKFPAQGYNEALDGGYD